MTNLTLAEIRKSTKLNNQAFRVADFASEEELAQLREAKNKKRQAPYDNIDALSAEIMARFGYDAWKDWQDGKIEMDEMMRFVAAERARDNVLLYDLENLITVLAKSLYKRRKREKIPKGFKVAEKIIKRIEERMRGLC